MGAKSKTPGGKRANLIREEEEHKNIVDGIQLTIHEAFSQKK